MTLEDKGHKVETTLPGSKVLTYYREKDILPTSCNTKDFSSERIIGEAVPCRHLEDLQFEDHQKTPSIINVNISALTDFPSQFDCSELGHSLKMMRRL